MDKLEAIAQEGIEKNVFPGCVIGTLISGERSTISVGETYPVYDVASITKSIPLASLTALLIEEGALSLRDKVRVFIPELHNDFDATIEDLLRYRVRGVQLSTLRFRTFEEIRTHALESGFLAAPGERVYTNFPAFILGMVLERVHGSSIALLAHHRLFEPLGMYDTTFFPARDLCAPTEIVEGETVQGVPHDESARVFARARRSVGHAGLFSTAQDLLTFAEYALMHPHSPVVLAAEQGLGWQVADTDLMGVHVSERAFGKTGFTGTSIIIDPAQKAALVILSNRTYPKRPMDGSAIYAFRRELADSFFGTL